MKVILIVIGSVIALIAVFIVWRLIATFRATDRRNRLIIEQIAPIVELLKAGKSPAEAELLRYAARSDTRRALYEALEPMGKESLFPSQYMTLEAAAEADMVFWLLHPNELGSVPDSIELMARVKRQHEGMDLEYFVYRFRMLEPHWLAQDGWTVGISGPYLENAALYAWAAGTFSTFEKYDSKTPEEHVDWLHATMNRKGAYANLCVRT
jgi:hypothetical protein